MKKEIGNEYINVEMYKTKYNLNWFNSACCLTGEAFFHKSTNEDCEYCINATYSSHVLRGSIEKFYEYKNDLAEHLKEEHPKTWKKWEKRL